ncbi:Elongator complex protein 1 [Tetrabaena socialis]|uniref:Elongator complex protein 1 n=1 Tax=Tetrabaena socialis TaxID=47790 RepID=A0A2J8A4V2_9CHLO|nr:Elongator complex protein 1 [Tetrabaena socialis]|eukprot:PNH07535.1 Elongator complex protein 1 [Tetrabaena socialis]
MRNLVVERDLGAQLDLGDDGALSFCVSAAEAQLYAITFEGVVHCFSLGERLQAGWCCDLGAELLASSEAGDVAEGASPAGSGAWVTSFSHVLELDALCIATRGGTIGLLHLGEGGGQRFEQVGSISDGVAALEWSPDGELLALLSGSGNLLVMNQAWELLHEGPALGPIATSAAPPPAPPPPPAAVPQPRDGGISWRGDGKYFAVVCPDPAAASGKAPPYRVAIWDRATLELHASGEAAEGLLPLPAWQPNGRHLYVPGAAAAPAKAETRPRAAAADGAPAAPAAGAVAGEEVASGGGGACRSVLLYERNGLRHGGFDLPSTGQSPPWRRTGPVCSMAWSCDSELLALVTSPGEAPLPEAGVSVASRDWVVQSQLASARETKGVKLKGGMMCVMAVMREGDMLAAMHAAMRPDVATAAARNVTVRAVEQGAALVACPAAALGGPLAGRLADVPVVLQMPRGNLEGVVPRALVLAALVLALRRLDYGEAWRLATVHRVELNLLVDYGWPSFIQHVPQFVAAVPRPSDLCDLLFALRPGSVLAQGGAYADALAMLGGEEQGPGLQAQGQPRAQGQQQQQQRGGAGPQAVARGQQPSGGAGACQAAAQQQREGAAAGDAGGGKVTAVCNAVREVVAALPGASSKYLEVVTTTYARSDPPQLEAAMRCIRDAKEAELRLMSSPDAPASAALAADDAAATAGSAPTPSGSTVRDRQLAAAAAAAAVPHNHSSAADKALKHLLLYVDADELYNTALGMYDMPLAYMVVVNAQKDPGEYLGELQGFASLAPPPLQRYHIDMHLRRFASALANLAQAGPQHFQQALQLARERGLLRQLLQLYDSDPDHRPAVLEAYGEHLEAAKRYDDAAVSYMSAGKLERALRAYRAAGRWRMVFVVAGQLEYDEEAVQSLAAELAEELAGSGQAADAAAVLLGYLGDVDNAVRVYTQAREWRESIRVAHAHQRSDLVETVIAPGAADGAASLLSEARDAEERIRKYGQRLADVRGKRLAMAEAIAAADEDGAAHGVPDDLQSDVVSLVSGLSVYTDATAGGATGASGSSASSRAPSTVGGRRAHRQDKKLKKAGAKIRQGSPLEEASLVAHVHGLAPRAAQLEEAGQLAELLVLLGHADDARLLQRTVAAWQAAYEEARSELVAHPVPIDGPGHARADMERLLQPAPDASSIAWKWDVLRGF